MLSTTYTGTAERNLFSINAVSESVILFDASSTMTTASTSSAADDMHLFM